MAETMVLAMEERYERYSLGRDIRLESRATVAVPSVIKYRGEVRQHD
jgi:predicted amino acid dehydrogenase